MDKLKENKGFTMMEMMLTLFVVSIILLISVNTIPEYNAGDKEDEISNISYFFKAAQTRSIHQEKAHTVLIDHESNKLTVRSLDREDIYEYQLTACSLKSGGLKRFNYLSSGNTNAFGSVILNCGGEAVRFVFQIQKGQFRIER
ncbi:competence type IV pilus minor pilin ComGD [Salinicoccus sp. YB14-2]|uniref:competence type IV pilus minor pilin ComGD n=1 Tax=Salinicoccus sp. YB14-2 TaxID=1572701 RepID=UPI0006916685|nr:competence type IV pilus minor pilin ComGD [Salinicoccus sp. YB14-2]